MKIFGKRIGVTKTKNITNDTYKPKAEILKKLEENLVKTVKVYSDYAKKVHKDDSLQETTDVSDNENIIDIQVEIFMQEQQLIQSLKYREIFEAVKEELSKSIENLDQSMNSTKISKYQDEINENIEKINENLKEYGEHLNKFNKSKKKTQKNAYRDTFIKKSETLIDEINICKNKIKNIKPIIETSKDKENINSIKDNIDNILDEFIFTEYYNEQNNHFVNNSDSFKDECIARLEKEYEDMNKKFIEIKGNIEVLYKKLKFLQDSYDYAKQISEMLDKYKNGGYGLDDIKTELGKCDSVGKIIIKNIDASTQKISGEKEQKLKEKEKNFLDRFNDEIDEVKKLVKQKIEEKEEKSSGSIDSISIKIQQLSKELNKAEKKLREKQKKGKNSYLGKLLSYNVDNKLLSIGNMSKSSFKGCCGKISSNQSKLIGEAKNTQKVAKKAKQIIKDIYDLESKVSKLDESKKKKEIDKIINLKEEYNTNIQELSKFSTTIDGLKIVGVDSLKL